MTDTYQTLRELLEPFLPADKAAIDADTPISGLGLKSVEVMEFITEVEDHFDVNIDLGSLAHVRTLQDLAAAVDEQVGK